MPLAHAIALHMACRGEHKADMGMHMALRGVGESPRCKESHSPANSLSTKYLHAVAVC